jgi:cytochrome c oxidase subunit 2
MSALVGGSDVDGAFMNLGRVAAAMGVVILVGELLLARQDVPRVIYITAERFSFTPSQVPVRLGEEVEFRITSEDTSHGFRIAGTSVNAAIPKRGHGALSMRFRPDRPGRYKFECNRMCGAGHDFMQGVVIVEDPTAPKTSR